MGSKLAFELFMENTGVVSGGDIKLDGVSTLNIDPRTAMKYAVPGEKALEVEHTPNTRNPVKVVYPMPWSVLRLVRECARQDAVPEAPSDGSLRYAWPKEATSDLPKGSLVFRIRVSGSNWMGSHIAADRSKATEQILSSSFFGSLEPPEEVLTPKKKE